MNHNPFLLPLLLPSPPFAQRSGRVRPLVSAAARTTRHVNLSRSGWPSCCLPLPPPPLLLPALTGPPSPCPPARLHPAPDQQERGESAHAMAVSLAQFARMRAGDPTHLSPFAYGAQQLGYRCVGEEGRQGGHGLARLRGLRGAAAAAACSAWRGQAGARLPASTRPLPSLHPSARSTPPLPSRPASYVGGKLDDITVLCGVVTPVEDGTGGAGGAPASNGAAPAAKM